MADMLVRDEGSVVMFTPRSVEGQAWVDDNLGLESWQWLGKSFAVEWRYAPDIVAGMQGDGLEVIPEAHEVTEADKGWLAELGIDWNPNSGSILASKKTTKAKPVQGSQINLRPDIEPDTTTQVPQQAAPSSLKSPTVVVVPEQGAGEKRTVPPELPNAKLHMAADSSTIWDEEPQCGECGKPLANCTRKGHNPRPWGITMAKLARGGWKRVSMFTVQSDDNRFTITIIDPTRRGKWFLLKDLETGEAYEEHTMTEAKQTALKLRGGGSTEFATENVYREENKVSAVKPSGYGMSSEGEARREAYQKLRRRYLYLAGKPRTPEIVAKLEAVIKELTEFEHTNKVSSFKNKLLKRLSI